MADELGLVVYTFHKNHRPDLSFRAQRRICTEETTLQILRCAQKQKGFKNLKLLY